MKMSEFYDTLLAPFRRFLGPVFDYYRKEYEYKDTVTIPEHVTSTLECVPLPDIFPDRKHNFVYSVYGPPDMSVKAGIVAVPAVVKMQDNYYQPTRPYSARPVDFLPPNTPMKEVFVDMPYELPTKFKSSTVATKHS